MFGWKRRAFFPFSPFFEEGVPRISGSPVAYRPSLGWAVFLGFLTLALGTSLRLLELPYWANPAYMVNNEYLLATHDAYHWIAGAEDFEFGRGHPMSELVRLLSVISGALPANVGFWMPPFLCGLLSLSVYFWGLSLGRPLAGLCAGVLASLCPGFFARTLLGYCDTDLVILLFVMLLGLIPTIWLQPWLAAPLDVFAGFRLARRRKRERTAASRREGGEAAQTACQTPLPVPRAFAPAGKLCLSRREMESSMLPRSWLAVLLVAGLLGHWTQAWHSIFPYMVRGLALFLPLLILALGPRGGRAILMRGALCHVLPLLGGLPGFLAGVGVAWLIRRGIRGEDDGWAARLIRDNRVLALGWTIALFLVLNTTILDLMLRSFHTYADRSGQTPASNGTGVDPLVYPQVTQSIIEVQQISFTQVLAYLYPLEWVAVLGIVCFLCLLPLCPSLLWFVPLVALSLYSVRMGGRMTMFGPPGLMLAMALCGSLAFDALCKRLKAGAVPLPRRLRLPVLLTLCLTATMTLAWPLITLLPDFTQGPVISREQARALSWLGKSSPPDCLVWNWWDWGYATHHFARRNTIADGARHGGPSLFLPAAVYSTADPRFARQLIKYTALKGNQPGNVFLGLSGKEAQALMVELGDKTKPLVDAPGKQYLVVSFELIRLGVWVTRYGSWNFERKGGSGSLMNNLSQALDFNMQTGQVKPRNGKAVQAGSIDVFSAGGVERETYDSDGYHFIFNPISTEQSVSAAEARRHFLARFWEWQRGWFSFTAGTNDKMVVDHVYYRTMMVQLLLCPPDDPAIAPYFRLVYDNVYCRIYEVL